MLRVVGGKRSPIASRTGRGVRSCSVCAVGRLGQATLSGSSSRPNVVPVAADCGGCSGVPVDRRGPRRPATEPIRGRGRGSIVRTSEGEAKDDDDAGDDRCGPPHRRRPCRLQHVHRRGFRFGLRRKAPRRHDRDHADCGHTYTLTFTPCLRGRIASVIAAACRSGDNLVPRTPCYRP